MTQALYAHMNNKRKMKKKKNKNHLMFYGPDRLFSEKQKLSRYRKHN
jgi:hypothetical protein